MLLLLVDDDIHGGIICCCFWLAMLFHKMCVSQKDFIFHFHHYHHQHDCSKVYKKESIRPTWDWEIVKLGQDLTRFPSEWPREEPFCEIAFAPSWKYFLWIPFENTYCTIAFTPVLENPRWVETDLKRSSSLRPLFQKELFLKKKLFPMTTITLFFCSPFKIFARDLDDFLMNSMTNEI